MNGVKINNRQLQSIKKSLNGMNGVKVSGKSVRNCVTLSEDKLTETYKVIKLLFEKEVLDISGFHTDDYSLSFSLIENQPNTYKNIHFRIEKGNGLSIHMDGNNQNKSVVIDDVDMYDNLSEFIIRKVNESKIKVYNEIFDDVLKISGLNRDLNLEGLLK